jgi:general secretion pathway protein A
MSGQHREALAHLLYGLTIEGGFVLLTGEVGTGKTTICRSILDQVPATCDVAFVLNPTLDPEELMASICDELGVSYPPLSSIKGLVDRINQHLLKAHAVGRKTVLIIEEAQNLTPWVLEHIRLLTNLETTTAKLLQIILIGQPELRDMLESHELRQLAQRITARYHIEPLARKDSVAYIRHRLGVAGAHQEIIPSSLSWMIHRITKGIPRLINIVCDRALLGAYVHGLHRVDRATLKAAAKEIRGVSAPGLLRRFRLLSS